MSILLIPGLLHVFVQKKYWICVFCLRNYIQLYFSLFGYFNTVFARLHQNIVYCVSSTKAYFFEFVFSFFSPLLIKYCMPTANFDLILRHRRIDKHTKWYAVVNALSLFIIQS